MTLPLENNTSKCIKRLAGRSIKTGRMRTAVTIAAIAVTTMLFTSVLTLAVGTMQSVTLSMQRMKGSKSDGNILYMDKEQYEALKNSSFVENVGLRMPVAYLSNTQKHNVELNVMDAVQMDMTFLRPDHGRNPEAPNEVVTSAAAIRELGAEPEVGARITIEFTAHGRSYSIPVTVSGWLDEPFGPGTSVMALPPAFCEAYPEVFEYTYPEDREMAGSYFSDFCVKSAATLERDMDTFLASVRNPAMADDGIGYTVNMATNPMQSVSTIAAACGAVLLFILCGYLLIYNIFDIAVIQDIRRYGLYRTIGMSKRQMRRTLNRQAVLLSAVGIPIGLALGFLIGRAALPAVMQVFAADMRKFMQVEVSLNPVIFIAGALFAALTVYISTRRPVRTVANVSPVEALRYVERGSVGRKVKGRRGRVSLMRMAWENIGRSKRRTVFIACSLLLCVVLLNSAFNLAGSVDLDKYTKEFVRTDFTVGSASAFNNTQGYKYHENVISQEVVSDIASQPWIVDGSVLYKNTLDDKNVTYDWGADFEELYPDADDPELFMGVSQGWTIGLGTDRHPLCNVVGLDEAGLSRLRLFEGETDPAVLWEKLQNGEGLLLGVHKQMGADVAQEAYDTGLEIGDTVTVRVNGEPAGELPVLAKTLYMVPDIDVANNTGSVAVGGDGPAIFLSGEQFKEFYEGASVMKYEFNVKEGSEKEAEAFLEAYSQEHGEVNYSTAEQSREGGESMRNMYLLVGGLLAAIFAFAGILNLINVLISSILTRRHEFATLQSIGMTARQLRGMVVLESLDYVLLSSVLGVAASVLVNSTVLKAMCTSSWFMTFRPMIWAAFIAGGVMIVFALLIAPVLLKIFQRGSVVERLREAE